MFNRIAASYTLPERLSANLVPHLVYYLSLRAKTRQDLVCKIGRRSGMACRRSTILVRTSRSPRTGEKAMMVDQDTLEPMPFRPREEGDKVIAAWIAEEDPVPPTRPHPRAHSRSRSGG